MLTSCVYVCVCVCVCCAVKVDMKTVKFLREQLKAALQESDSVHQKRVTKYVR